MSALYPPYVHPASMRNPSPVRSFADEGAQCGSAACFPACTLQKSTDSPPLANISSLRSFASSSSLVPGFASPASSGTPLPSIFAAFFSSSSLAGVLDLPYRLQEEVGRLEGQLLVRLSG